MVKRSLLLLFIISLGNALLADAGSDRDHVQQILAHWNDTTHRPIYYEETVVRFDGQSSHLIKKRLWKNSEEEFRLEITLEDGRTVTTVTDGKNKWVIDSSARVVLREAFKRTPRVHQAPVSLDGNVSVVADTYFERPVYVITVEWEGVVHRLWIDKETYILWKEERHQLSGESVYIAYKTKVDWSPVLDKELFTYTEKPGETVVSDRRQWLERRIQGDYWLQSGFRLRYPSNLPNGFSFFRAEVTRPKGIPIVVLQFRRNGELLSIFQQRGRLPERAIELMEGRLRGADGKEVNIAYRTEDDMSYVAIGQLDVSQLEEILDSLR